MKLEEGMFIRYEGLINKILEIDEDYIVFDNNWYDHWADEVSSMKYDRFVNDYKPVASHNIIDLIEVGDYVNGNKIIKISTDFCGRNILIYGYDDGDRQVAITIYEDEIKSIVTKEQFDSVMYKVGE